MAKYQIIIGRAENIDFVGAALGVPAKIDTGAFRSAIHASDMKEVTKDSIKMLRFNILGHPCSPVKRAIETSQYDRLDVKSSNGKVETRYVVTLKIKIANKVFNTSFTLADRSNNVYPVLIGRKALKNRFVVDVNQSAVKRLALKRNFGVLAAEDEEDLED